MNAACVDAELVMLMTAWHVCMITLREAEFLETWKKLHGSDFSLSERKWHHGMANCSHRASQRSKARKISLSVVRPPLIAAARD